MRIAITGATGLLGRNLLFEIIKQNLLRLNELKIFILGRSEEQITLQQRLEEIFLLDGKDYIGLDIQKDKQKIQQIFQCLILVDFDLTQDKLGLTEADFISMKACLIDFFFHIAALTDFRSGVETERALESVNVKGTERILNLLDELSVAKFIYVGSAYSCGLKVGVIEPHFVNHEGQFRNPYEASKLKAEIMVRKYCAQKKIPHKIFRPSTICGRLHEKPVGSICKFDVFYSWAAFFLREKLKHVKDFQVVFEKDHEFKIRIKINPQSGLNIVPADYAAKVIYSACFFWEPHISYHLANANETPHKDYISWMFEAIKISGHSFVDEEPENKQGVEKLYYKTVGKIFTPYIISGPVLFGVDEARRAAERMKVKCPPINKENFSGLMEFAKKHKFGMTV